MALLRDKNAVKINGAATGAMEREETSLTLLEQFFERVCGKNWAAP